VPVCDPRKNALVNTGNKRDRIDARKLAELLRSNLLRPVYHGEHGVQALKDLPRSYLAIPSDLAPVTTRRKAVYRSGRSIFLDFLFHRTRDLCPTFEAAPTCCKDIFSRQLLQIAFWTCRDDSRAYAHTNSLKLAKFRGDDCNPYYTDGYGTVTVTCVEC
jgi:hypothetical protein